MNSLLSDAEAGSSIVGLIVPSDNRQGAMATPTEEARGHFYRCAVTKAL